MQPEEVGAMAKLSKSEVSERLKKLKGWTAGCRHHQERVPIPVISQGDQIR